MLVILGAATGLILDDAVLALLVLAFVAMTALLIGLGFPPLAAGAVLLGGCLLALIVSAARVGRASRARHRPHER